MSQVSISLRRTAARRLAATGAAGIAIFLMFASSSNAQVELTTPLFYNAGPLPMKVGIGDLDQDGDKDLLVINRQGHLRIRFNNGAGCFSDSEQRNGVWRLPDETVWPHRPSMSDGVLGDLDGDGRVDLTATSGDLEGTVSVSIGLDNGTFAPPLSYNACSSVKNLAVGDLNADGANDLAVTSNCFKATILLNDGFGGLAARGSFGSGYTTTGIAMNDLDGDGDNDVAFLSTGLSSVSVILNNGDGTFGAAGGAAVGDNPWDLALVDLDGDAHPDLITVNVYSNDVSVLRNDGHGKFPALASFGVGAGPEALAAGDLDRDGRIDLAVANGGSNDVSILLNAGHGAFASPIRVGAGISPNDVALEDLDGDSRLDIVVLNRLSENLAVFLNRQASGCPAPPVEPPNDIFVPIFTKAIVDGPRRLVVLNWGTDARSSTVTVFRNGVKLANAPNTSYFWDDVTRKKGRTFTYEVCETGAFRSCSALSTVTF